ncbi:hypothetical protein [Lentilactobacillus sp. Marseille-Q4993]|uniref:hypothetical protein n=1 Tax=Lentilactobacillus sp. Marseille-Q4993 TaxID=3039492 RepID=UPI0024BBF5FC|nr:hypothetical protein [Lentilactobacillus sp. Marseille-Q4993]
MKLFKFSGVLLLALVLGGCAAGNNSSKSSNSNSSSKTEMSNSSSQSSSDSQTSNSESTSTSSGSQASSSENQSPSFASNTKQLAAKLPGVLLPQSTGLSSSQPVNIRYTGNSSSATVYYSVGQSNLALNDKGLANKASYATLTKKDYASSSQAASNVDYQDGSQNKGLPKVNLGHSIIGRLQSGAGQQYISWNEGRWSVVVHGSPVNNTSPKKAALQTVALFEQYSLPAPQKVGSVKFESGQNTGLAQTITWQNGKSVYTLKANDPNVAVAMGASMK